ncbi:ABC transporter ATP-binding protein [Skermanella aerolata]|uniref:ABC transporter ATP-binding protein n=1 Tax=Skermanella aerolata TaxID=393310 RepID=A0A512DIF1_9PROT|nr:ABC transporter ATP-binding protein [Skermanella aerolata]KJB97518.1 peptide ABC transporter ATP-binding protein [Skermanella aerolata KACC 11604]GEO36261.1 ABC transporter ATP-binding protein [Skermanella aerolata]
MASIQAGVNDIDDLDDRQTGGKADAVAEIRNLQVGFRTDQGSFNVLDGVSFTVRSGRTLCLVGESGCGKSVTALSIMGLLAPTAHIGRGEILLEGTDILKLDRKGLNERRGDRMAMIFQEPMTSLNPVFTIGDQITEGILRHRQVGRADAHKRAVEMLRKVRIPAPEQRMTDYPHQLSGGMRQRVMIAMALANDPRLLIADEPTTALDVTIQAQILELIRTLQDDTGTAVLLITHDLGVVAEVGDDVAVMYAGRIVEQAAVTDLFADPQHPYTLGLLSSIPRLDADLGPLPTIRGSVPAPSEMPAGCRFSTRCPFADDHCRTEEPPLAEIATGHKVACWKAPLEENAA